MSRSRPCLGLLTAMLVGPSASEALAQTPADGWSGQVQCVLSVRAPASGYQDDQTQTWTVTGTAIPRNDFRDYPATWTVTGTGSRAPSDSWTRTGSDSTGSITLFVPVGTNNIRVAPGQRVLKTVGGIRATVASVPVTGDADEWRFQYFDTPGATTQTTFSGSRTQMRTDLVGFRQPAGASVTETCSWSFAKGSLARVATLSTQQPTLTTQSGAQAGTATQVTLSSAGSTTTIQQVAPTVTATGTLANEPLASGSSPRTDTTALNTSTRSLLGPAPRTITLAGFTAAGTTAAVLPRTIMLTGFTGAGTATPVTPRTITLTGFTGTGTATPVTPRTITLPGWTAVGP